MGFHCGNTASCLVKEPEMKFQRIMKRNLEPDSEPNISRGTLEGDIVDGNITFFRFQSTADAQLKGYIAEGEVLPVATRSFGSIGIFAINEMGRFYRHVLVQKNYPHHGAVAFWSLWKGTPQCYDISWHDRHRLQSAKGYALSNRKSVCRLIF